MVLDASVVLDLLLWPQGGALAASVLAENQPLHAPHLLDLEIAQALRKLCRGRVTTAPRAEQALVDLSELPLARHGHRDFMPRIWSLRHVLTAYDAAYLALAEALDCQLLTRDRGLAAAAGERGRLV